MDPGALVVSTGNGAQVPDVVARSIPFSSLRGVGVEEFEVRAKGR